VIGLKAAVVAVLQLSVTVQLQQQDNLVTVMQGGSGGSTAAQCHRAVAAAGQPSDSNAVREASASSNAIKDSRTGCICYTERPLHNKSSASAYSSSSSSSNSGSSGSSGSTALLLEAGCSAISVRLC
jgi:hypothetical protein